MSRKKITAIGLCVTLVVAIVTISILVSSHDKTDVYADKIDYNFKQMSEGYELSDIVSSSPYDYIDDKMYDEVVNIGFDAVDILEEKLEIGELGELYGYIAGLMIQDITECNIYEVTGQDWANINEFENQWEKLMAEIPERLKEIVEDDRMTAEEKCSELEKYGVFAQPIIEFAINDDGIINAEYVGENIEAEFKQDDIIKIKKIKKKYKGASNKKILKYIKDKKEKS